MKPFNKHLVTNMIDNSIPQQNKPYCSMHGINRECEYLYKNVVNNLSKSLDPSNEPRDIVEHFNIAG